VSGKIDGSGVRKEQKVCCNKAEQSTAHGRGPLVERSIEDVHGQMCGSGPTSSLASCVAIDGGLSIKGSFLKCCTNPCAVRSQNLEVKTSLLLSFPDFPAGFILVRKLTVLVKRYSEVLVSFGCSPLKLQLMDVS
jgi:hypothetical protein